MHGETNNSTRTKEVLGNIAAVYYAARRYSTLPPESTSPEAYMSAVSPHLARLALSPGTIDSFPRPESQLSND
ncbi:hypothetical protein BH10PAT3_BH10PAT3_4750 [soil metagenome]